MWRPRDRERFIGSYDPEREMPDPDRDPGDRWQSDAYRRNARDTRFMYRMNPDMVERGHGGPRRDMMRDMDARWHGDGRDYEREHGGGGRWAAGGGRWERDDDRGYDRGGDGGGYGRGADGGGYGRGGYGAGGYGGGGYGGGYGGGGYDRDRWGGGDDRSFDRGWNRDFDRDRDFDRGGFMTGPRFDRDQNWGSDRGWDTDRGSDRWDRGGYDDWQRDWRRR